MPSLEALTPTLRRESAYWARAFRGALTRDDLFQEGYLIACKVARYHDPKRGAAFNTLLTLALRQHFKRLVKTTLTRVFQYTPEQQARLRINTPTAYAPHDAADARLLVETLSTLPADLRGLAFALDATGGKIAPIAREAGVSVRLVAQHVALLRAALRKGR